MSSQDATPEATKEALREHTARMFDTVDRPRRLFLSMDLEEESETSTDLIIGSQQDVARALALMIGNCVMSYGVDFLKDFNAAIIEVRDADLANRRQQPAQPEE